MNPTNEALKIGGGLVLFLIGYATYQAAQPNGGTVWTGGMLVGALLALSGVWRLLRGAPGCGWKRCRKRRTHEVHDFNPAEPHRDAGLCDFHTAVVLYQVPGSWARNIATETEIKTPEERASAIRRLGGE